MESNKLEYKLYNKSVVVLHEWMDATQMSLWYVDSFPLDQYQAWLNAAHFGQDMARVDTSFAHLSRAFREPFARNRKKNSRYYLLSGLSRIFRKPFANVYISRKVPFAQTFQIYACGPRLYKTFHGFLHDSHIYIYQYINIPCRSTPVFKTVFTKRLFYSANDCFPYPAASTPAIFFKSVCYVQLWPWFGSVKAASTCPRGSCLYFMRNWFKNESSAVNGAWIRVKAEWKEVLSRERRF